MSKYRHKKDRNHDEVAKAFIDDGWDVHDNHKEGDGAPDLVVARQIFYVEVKGERGKKTAKQKDEFNGRRVYTVRSGLEAKAFGQYWRSQNGAH